MLYCRNIQCNFNSASFCIPFLVVISNGFFGAITTKLHAIATFTWQRLLYACNETNIKYKTAATEITTQPPSPPPPPSAVQRKSVSHSNRIKLKSKHEFVQLEKACHCYCCSSSSCCCWCCFFFSRHYFIFKSIQQIASSHFANFEAQI